MVRKKKRIEKEKENERKGMLAPLTIISYRGSASTNGSSTTTKSPPSATSAAPCFTGFANRVSSARVGGRVRSTERKGSGEKRLCARGEREEEEEEVELKK